MSSAFIRTQRQSQNPIDSVQQILWDPSDRNCRTFFTCGWDGIVRLYQIVNTTTSKKLQKKWQHYFFHPIICMDLIPLDKLVIVGLASGQIGVVDLQNSKNLMCIGSHNAPVCKVFWIQKFEVIVSFGFDNLMKIYSLKNVQNNNYQISQIQLPCKTNTVSYSHPYFLVGAQDGKIAMLNMQKIRQININNQYQTIFDQSHGLVKFTTSVLSNQRGRILLGTADGRLVSTTFSQGMNGVRINKPVVGKYQKKTSYRKDLCGQMNGIDFGMRDNRYQFAVYCGTEEIGVYSPQKSSKIKALSSTSTAVTAVSLSPDCQYYAFALGSDWNKGLDQLSLALPVKLCVGRLTNSDVTPLSNSYVR